jgi:hypothetical protein
MYQELMSRSKRSDSRSLGPKGRPYYSPGHSAAAIAAERRPGLTTREREPSPEGAALASLVTLDSVALSGLSVSIWKKTQGGASRLSPLRSALGWYGVAPSVLQSEAILPTKNPTEIISRALDFSNLMSEISNLKSQM